MPNPSRIRVHVVDCQGDGNCAFRAMALQLWGTENGHQRLRQEVVQRYRTLGEAEVRRLYAPEFRVGSNNTRVSFDEYCTFMGGLTHWAGLSELMCLGDLYTSVVQIYSYTTQLLSNHVPTTLAQGQLPTRVLRAVFTTANHWQALIPITSADEDKQRVARDKDVFADEAELLDFKYIEHLPIVVGELVQFGVISIQELLPSSNYAVCMVINDDFTEKMVRVSILDLCKYASQELLWEYILRDHLWDRRKDVVKPAMEDFKIALDKFMEAQDNLKDGMLKSQRTEDLHPSYIGYRDID